MLMPNYSRKNRNAILHASPQSGGHRQVNISTRIAIITFPIRHSPLVVFLHWLDPRSYKMPSSGMTCYDSPFAIEAHVARSFELTNGMHPKALRMSSGPDVDGLSAITMYVVRRSPSFHR